MKSLASQSPSLMMPSPVRRLITSVAVIPVGIAGAVKVHVSTPPGSVPFVSVQLNSCRKAKGPFVGKSDVKFDAQERPPFVVESSAPNVIVGVLTVVSQATLKAPVESAKNCADPQLGRIGSGPGFTFIRPSTPSARTILDAK